ncbi:MAG: amidase [Chloroflexi bacterium]|nr:MAG: amidase [Actinobacteria bacterium 13_2_20CM_2_66_6]TMC90346.1 MAG: amidase [Chloroflexota bacterium]TME11317.1 MAG: amidase [Chloroflexota bacterium]TME95919.1 MAG: amidase [Chloroflexota bacterium]
MAERDQSSYASAAELARRIRSRELSPVELMTSTIKRIEQRNPSLNAFVFTDFDQAMERARAAESAVTSGATLGPLHGVPTAMKDLFDFKPGWPSTFGGIRTLRDQVIDAYCPYSERMERAGAILVGKTNAPIMGLRGIADNYLFGPTHNPFDLSRNPGGSSGGSAAAVADGLVSIAEGTDAGGSIRIPAAWCNVYGYRASYGRVAYTGRPNAFASLNPFVFEGTLTRTVEDAAIGLQILAGPDSRDPFSLTSTPDFTAALAHSLSGAKVAFSPDFDVYPIESAVAGVVAEATRGFVDAGATVETVKVGIKRSQRELSDLWNRMIMPLNISGLEGLKAAGIDLMKDHPEDLPPEYRHWIEVGYGMSAMDVWNDMVMRTEVYDAIESVLQRYDLLVTPTLACLPVKNTTDGNTLGPTQINGEEVDPLIGWCLTFLTNFSGHPSASIPAGLSGGLPVGMQIIGRREQDVDVLAASAAFERVRPWTDGYRICEERPLS